MMANTQRIYAHWVGILLILLSHAAWAQQAPASAVGDCPKDCPQSWCWGDKADVARDRFARYYDKYQQRQFKEALPDIEWLMTNVPCLNKMVYQNAAICYGELEKAELDSAAKRSYQDKCLKAYDDIYARFGEDGNILQAKAMRAYNYLISRKNAREYYMPLFELYNRTYELKGDATNDYVLKILMKMVQVRFVVLKNIEMTQVMDYYRKISATIAANKQQYPNEAKWEEAQKFVDGILSKTI